MSEAGAPVDRSEGVVRWQWALYPENHVDRRNLAVHAVTNPLFLAGSIAIVAAPFLGGWWALGGVAAMAVAMAGQGRGHATERVAPVPFRGAADAVVRIFVEQWVTWPRFVLTGGLARAWRAAGRGRQG